MAFAPCRRWNVAIDAALKLGIANPNRAYTSQAIHPD